MRNLKTGGERASIKPGNLMMAIAAVLFCLVLISTYLMGDLYARYTTSGTGKDSARVAEFGTLTMTESGDYVFGDPEKENKLENKIIPGVDLKKKVEISFTGSEMATIVFVEVTLSDHWSKASDADTFSIGDKVTWRVADGWELLDETQYVYYRILASNQQLDNIDFIADEGTITVSDQLTEAQIAALDEAAITVSLQASVIQAGGFATVADAWAHLNP